MTKKEAIEFGKTILLVADSNDDESAIEFTRIAISALEQEPCDDAIDRAEAMTEIMMSKSIVAFNRDLWIRTKDAVHILRELPSITQKSGKCKTCKYWQDNNNGYPSDMCKWRTDETPNADDYCSEYEPQESEDKG